MSMADDQPAVPWMTRRKQAEEQCAALLLRPDEETAGEVVRLASDPKWEVRKVVAESMAAFPEKVFRELSILFASERNALVAAAFERSLARRSPVADIAPAHADLLQGEVDKITHKFGPDAADAALKFAERCTFLHIRSAGHDLKNILSYLKLDPDALLKEPANAKHKSKIQRYKNGRDYLHRLSEMMEVYSSPLDIRVQPEDLVEMAFEAITAAREQVEKGGVDSASVACDVEAPESVIVPVSRYHIAMALTNLVKNGIQAYAAPDSKFGEGRVLIRISKDADCVTITVADGGCGIAPGDLQNLVQFIPGGTAKRGGSGYGLPICRRYLQAHGGRIWLESTKNTGTTVTVTIPCNPCEPVL